jgi:hypothetical protein
MKHLLPVLALLAGLGSSVSFSQTICLGSDGKPCPPGWEMQLCDDEIVTSNLFVAKPVKLIGVLFDPTGAPITFEKTFIQIRDSQSKIVLLSTQLDVKGRFDLGTVPAGNYRFLAVWIKEGKIKRLPLADQPTDLFCSDETECVLRIVIRFHGTDNPIDFCPPK